MQVQRPILSSCVKGSSKLLMLVVLLWLFSLVHIPNVFATAGINEQINFQGKVVNSDGTNVNDGDYDFVFKIYTVDTAGTAVWTETLTLTNQVTVTDGIFRVALGAVQALPGSIDFNSDALYLGVNFNSDGEMSPRIRLTAVPYAFNAAKVAGLTVTDTTGTLTIPAGITVAYSGSNDVTFTTTAATNITLPTTGTLATLDGTETFTNKTIDSTGLTVEDNTWVGLGSGVGRIEFDDQTTDEVNILGANIGIGTSAPGTTVHTYEDTTATTPQVKIEQDGTGDAGLWFNLTSTIDWVLGIDNSSSDSFKISQNSALGTNDFLTILSGGGVTFAGPVTGMTTLSSSGDWTWSATTPSISINSGETLGISDGTDTFSINTTGSSFSYSDGSNSVSFDVDSGPSYAGTARPAKTITLSPEYSGGTLTAFYGAGTDSSITGSMTADAETTSAKDLRTYYEWSSSQTSLNYYTVAVRVKLPADFSAWATSNALTISFTTESTSTANNTVDAYVYLSSDTTSAVASDTSNVAAVAATWENITVDDSTLDDASAPEWDAASETAIIYLRLGSKDNNFARIGDITLNYLAAF